MSDIFLVVQRNYGSTEKYTVTECRGQWLAERHPNCPPLLKAYGKDGYGGMSIKEFWEATQS